MRKFALQLAAALIVSAPIVASSPTETYAAAKKKEKAGKAGKRDTGDPNTAFIRALTDDLSRIGQPAAESGKGKGKAAKKSSGKKKTAKKGGKKPAKKTKTKKT